MSPDPNLSDPQGFPLCKMHYGWAYDGRCPLCIREAEIAMLHKELGRLQLADIFAGAVRQVIERHLGPLPEAFSAADVDKALRDAAAEIERMKELDRTIRYARGWFEGNPEGALAEIEAALARSGAS